MFLALYWSVLELPQWLRRRTGGWLPACIVRASVVHRVAGSTAAVFLAILKKTYGPEGCHNPGETGVRLPGVDCLFRARFQGLLGDEKFIKEVYSVKGASGMKPCLFCKNLVSNSLGGDDYFKTLSASRVGVDFDAYTDETLFAAADLLAQRSIGATARVREDLEKVMGINWDPHSLLYNPTGRGLVRPISGTCFDWTHCLCSNGVLQEELDQFGCVLLTSGFTLQQLDEFCAKVTMPKRCAMTWPFWQARWRGPLGAGGGLRIFAGETLTLGWLVGLFCELVLAPRGHLTANVECFSLLLRATSMLQSGDAVLRALPDLQRLLERHHQQFCDLYPEAVRPKFHFLLHVPGCLGQMGANVSCFATERKHRTTADPKLPETRLLFSVVFLNKARKLAASLH